MPSRQFRIAAIFPQELEYSGRLLEGATAYASEHRHITLVDLAFSVDAPWEAPFDEGKPPFDAALVWATTEARWVERILSASLPVVSAGCDWPVGKIPIVAFDGNEVVEVAIDHLIRRKPASLAHFEFCFEQSEVLRKRSRYFQEVGTQKGILTTSHHVFGVDDPDHSSLGRRTPLKGRSAERVADILRGLKLPAGVWCGDDYLGLRICEVAQSIGLAVPEDLAVLGLHDLRCAATGRPPLSSIPLPGALIGFKAMGALDNKLSGKAELPIELSISPPSVVARESTVGDLSDDPAGRALKLITERACQGITVGELAKHTGVSAQTLHARCLARTGQTPGELIKREKIATAKRLLRDPRMTIGGVAERCGYEQQSNFSNFFRRETGFTPRAWRQANP
jgi:LacI family transcriptional regulator